MAFFNYFICPITCATLLLSCKTESKSSLIQKLNPDENGIEASVLDSFLHHQTGDGLMLSPGNISECGVNFLWPVIYVPRGTSSIVSVDMK